MKKILITGAGGTVGIILTTHFTDLGIPVVAVDRSEMGVANLLRIRLRQANPIMLDVRYGDLMKRDFVFEVIHGEFSLQMKAAPQSSGQLDFAPSAWRRLAGTGCRIEKPNSRACAALSLELNGGLGFDG